MRFGGDQQQGDPLADRRQRAREAGQNAWADAVAVPSVGDRAANAINDAIETATRVKITPEIVCTAALKYPVVEEIIKAALRAAGFEVEE